VGFLRQQFWNLGTIVMSLFIFAVQPALGHLNPMLSIAHQMRSEGHTVIFLCPAPELIKRVVEGNGFRLLGFRTIHPSLYPLGSFLLSLPSGYMETFHAIKLCFTRLSFFTRAVRHVLDELQPAAVVSDFSFPGACLAAESRGIPYTVIYHAGLCFKGPGIPSFGSGLPIGGDWGRRGKLYAVLSSILERNIGHTVARVRKRLGLPPGGNGLFTWSPYLNLVLTAEAAEAPRFPLPPTFFFIGPCLTGRKGLPGEDGFSFSELSSERPRIYVSMGSFFNNRPQVFRKIITAFSGGEEQIIVKAGDSFSRLRSLCSSSNTLLFRNVPQLELLPDVDAVISHGGNNTVNETLSAGKPLLVMPVGGEQGDNAARVEYLGVGLRAHRKRSTAREIGVKARCLLEESGFRQCAGEIAGALSLTDGPVTASRFITRLEQTRKPVLRPDGYPLTVTRELAPPWEFEVG